MFGKFVDEPGQNPKRIEDQEGELGQLGQSKDDADEECLCECSSSQPTPKQIVRGNANRRCMDIGSEQRTMSQYVGARAPKDQS